MLGGRAGRGRPPLLCAAKLDSILFVCNLVQRARNPDGRSVGGTLKLDVAGYTEVRVCGGWTVDEGKLEDAQQGVLGKSSRTRGQEERKQEDGTGAQCFVC